jgi:acid phosphatase type 7
MSTPETSTLGRLLGELRALARFTVAALGLCALLALGLRCDGLTNDAGRVHSDRVGDVSNPPAERVSPEEGALGASCGDAPVAGDGAGGAPGTLIIRRPYLQRVAEDTATVVWTSLGEAAGELHLEGGGGPPVTVAAVQDTSVLAARGVRQWTATLAGLRPDTRYCYEIREDGLPQARAGFTTAPAAASPLPVRFVAFGDSGGGGADQAAVTAQMATVRFDFMIHTGDIAYEEGTRAELEARFFRPYAHLLDHVAMFPASGNHDYATEGASPFREAFVLPENGGTEGRERWYSFDWGPVHLVALDTELTGAAQAAWLEADLAANRRPWVVVYGHRPPFSSGKHGSDRAFRKVFVPVLERHRVPLVLTGHEHDYERSTPQNGVTYVVTGGGGRGTRSVGSSSFTAFSSDVLHFVYITVAGDTLALHAIDASGAEFDSLVIRRPP